MRFDIQPPGKTGEIAIGRNYAMTGHDDRKRILAAGRAHRAAGLRGIDCLGDVQVALGFAEGNLAQAAPDFSLKLGAARFQRQLKAGALAGEVLGQLPLGVFQDRMTRRGYESVELHPLRCFVLPKYRHQRVLARDQL